MRLDWQGMNSILMPNGVIVCVNWNRLHYSSCSKPQCSGVGGFGTALHKISINNFVDE